MKDWQTFLKFDNAATIDLLTSFAAGLSSEGLIAERCVDNLKANLAVVTPQLADTSRSVMNLLAEQDLEFIGLLTTRYGATGFPWNHFRLSTRNLLSESCVTLADWADQILKKAELFMNRPFISSDSFGQTRRELFPSVLFNFAKALHDSIRDLKSTIFELSLMRSADTLDITGLQYDIEQRIALQVGFSGLESETLSFCRTELRAISRIGQTYNELGSCILQFTKGLIGNTALSSSTRSLETDCEIFIAECQRFASTKIDVTSNLNVWETRRLGYLYEIFSLNLQIRSISKLFVAALSPKEKLSSLELMTTDVERAIAIEMIGHGSSVSSASKASSDLLNYCKSHNMVPRFLISAELKKINSELRDETLSLAVSLTEDSFMATPGGSNEKNRFLEGAKKIRKALNVAVPFSAPLLIGFFIFLTASCGVKTAVVSDLRDPRPEISFHPITPTAKPQNSLRGPRGGTSPGEKINEKSSGNTIQKDEH